MKQITKISGFAYIMIFIGGFYANFAVLESLVDLQDPSGTYLNLINNHSQFGYGLIGFLVMLVFDSLLIWSLFKLTETVSRTWSYAASGFRLLHAAFFLIALARLFQAYLMTGQPVSTDQEVIGVFNLLQQFDKLWTIGLLFFGIHLLLLGSLAIRSGFIPRTLGVLLVLAAAGYLVDGTAKLFLSTYNDFKNVFETIVVLTGVVGELSFTIWLIIKGLRKQG